MDAMLLQKLKEGNTMAYRALYSKYWEQTYNSIYKRLKNHDQAEDITQDIFLQLWVKREEVQIENLGAYLFVSGRNSVYRWMAEQHKFTPIAGLITELESYGERPDAKLLTMEFMRAYEALIDTLPGAQQTIFRLRYQQDLSPDEIATQLDLSPKTVRNQLGRALATLRSSLTALAVIASFLNK